MSLHLCHPYVWEDPRFIFKSFNYDGTCMSEMVNRVVLVYLLAIVSGLLLGSFLNKSWMALLFGLLATIGLIPTFLTMRSYQKKGEEGFVGEDSDEELPLLKTKEIEPLATKTTAANPFQNVTIDDYKYAPTREAAPNISSPESKVALDAMFRTQWYSDPTDVFGKTQSQRMFITQPNTTIPNDQSSFRDWLYKIPGKTCKEGNYEACYGGTNGAVIPWLNS
jgi:hypothetical protein